MVAHDCSLICEDGELKQGPEVFEANSDYSGFTDGGTIRRIGSSGAAGHDEINAASPSVNPAFNFVETFEGVIEWTNPSECRDAIVQLASYDPDTRGFVSREPDDFGTAALDLRQLLRTQIGAAPVGPYIVNAFAQYNSAGNGTVGDYSYSQSQGRTLLRTVPAGETLRVDTAFGIFKTGNGHPVTTVFWRPLSVTMIAHLV